ncbi:LysR family transcriptional regulator [Shewanella corallii]|uniref:HTH-type transcriptional regulator MetR n=1 Tax=Shewanella corallii TaxID=560080 RepID=A0ABT0NCP0_9GAMM|nr:LysR family transcriptional regulator [Shewanella corallii]MCL2915860.1 LysR family transcriptional regulator [Shewanella corallii]
MIELRHLRTLVALKESGSLAAAAKKRFVTQSALSHQIKELETRINSPIFIRKSKPLSFTQEGIRLVQLAEEILPRVTEIEQVLKRGVPTQRQQLTVAIECHSCVRWLMPVMEQFRQRHPGAELNLSSRHLFNAIHALENEELDLVLTPDPAPSHRIAYQHLFDYEMKLVVSSDHPLAEKPFVTPQDLAGQPLLSYPVKLERLDIYRHFLEPAGVLPGEQKTCDLTMMLLQRIACQEGIAALPSWSVSEAQGLSLKTVRLGQEGMMRPMFGAYHRSATNASLIQSLLTLLNDHQKNR